MADLLTIDSKEVTPDQYGAIINDYVKNVILPEGTEEEVTNAYVNLRVWLDYKDVTTEGIAYIDANKEEAYAVATGPDYAEVLEAQGKDLPKTVEVKPKADFKKIAFLAAALGLAIWFLFIKDSQGGTE